MNSNCVCSIKAGRNPEFRYRGVRSLWKLATWTFDEGGEGTEGLNERELTLLLVGWFSCLVMLATLTLRFDEHHVWDGVDLPW